MRRHNQGAGMRPAWERMACVALAGLVWAVPAAGEVKVWRVGDQDQPWNVTPVTDVLPWGRGWAVEVVADDDGDGLIDEDPVELVDNDGDGLYNEDGPEAQVDTDNDGQINEDGPNGIDDGGDGQIDEDPIEALNSDRDEFVDEDGIDPQIDNDGDGLLNEDSRRTVADDDLDSHYGARTDEDPIDGRDNDGDGLADEDAAGHSGVAMAPAQSRWAFRYDVTGIDVDERRQLQFHWRALDDNADGQVDSLDQGVGQYEAVRDNGDTVVATAVELAAVAGTDWIRPVYLDSTRSLPQILFARLQDGQFGGGLTIVPTHNDQVRREGASPFFTINIGPGLSTVDAEVAKLMYDGLLTTHFQFAQTLGDRGSGMRLQGNYYINRILWRPRPSSPDAVMKDYWVRYGIPSDIIDESMRATRTLVPVTYGKPKPITKDFRFDPPRLMSAYTVRARTEKEYLWEIAEAGAYGEGYAQDGQYISEIIDVGVQPARAQRYGRIWDSYRITERDSVETQWPELDGELVTWGRVRWRARRHEGCSSGDIRIQFRVGNTFDQYEYARKLGEGLYVLQDDAGEFIDAFGWAKLPGLERTPEPDLAYNLIGTAVGELDSVGLGEVSARDRDRAYRRGWTFWSAPLRFDEGLIDDDVDLDDQGVTLKLPAQMRYLQFRILFDTTKDCGVAMDWLEFEYDAALVNDGVQAEIFPRTVPIGQDTTFQYFVEPRFTRGSSSQFNRLDIDVPSPDTRVLRVRVTDFENKWWQEIEVPDTEDVDPLLKVQPGAQEFAQAIVIDPVTQRPRLTLKLPHLGEDTFGAGSRVVVQVDLRSALFTGSAQFTGAVWDDQQGSAIRQPVADGDATDEVSTNSVTVVADLLTGLTGPITVAPNPFTPNGDGQRDAVMFRFGLYLATAEIDVSLEIRDLSGRLVATETFRRLPGPIDDVSWDGRDDGDNLAPPGVYLYRLEVGKGDAATVHVGTVTAAY